MATIITKNSQTPGAVPSAASLSVGELAVNTADGKLYTEHTGGVVKEIIPSTVVDGGITGAKLENSGVTAGTYGSSSLIPIVTVDAKGRVTSASTTSFSATPADGSITDAKIADGLSSGTTWYPVSQGGISQFRDSSGQPSTSPLLIGQARVLRGGTYQFRCRVYNTWDQSGTFYARIYQNGVALGSTASASIAYTAGGTLNISAVTLTAGAIVQLYAWSNAFNVGGQYFHWQYGVSSNNIKLNAFSTLNIVADGTTASAINLNI